MQKFRTDNPDLTQYEDLVTSFAQTKTDPRQSTEKRLLSAAKQVREFLETERNRGVEQASVASKEKDLKEAKADGLDTEASPGEKAPDKEPSLQDYVDYRTRLKELKVGKLIY